MAGGLMPKASGGMRANGESLVASSRMVHIETEIEKLRLDVMAQK
jgi:hypothetical protein